MINVKLMDKEFVARNFQYKQVRDYDGYYIYELTTPEEGSPRGYEVIKKNITPICLDFANRIYSDTDFKEHFPKSGEAGGTSVWWFAKLEKAESFIHDPKKIKPVEGEYEDE